MAQRHKKFVSCKSNDDGQRTIINAIIYCDRPHKRYEKISYHCDTIPESEGWNMHSPTFKHLRYCSVGANSQLKIFAP